MSFQKSLLGFISIAGLLLGASLALAEDAPPAGNPGLDGSAWCKENPGKCDEARAKHAAFCKENPDKCNELSQKRAERQAFCKENPEKCAEQREKFKQQRAERKAQCAADPEKCEEMKQARRERFKKRHGGGGPPADQGSGKAPGETGKPPSE
jgi:hypothetical protein